jgi:hypothetical protein
MEQPKPIYGWRISILGLWQEHVGFEYGLAKGGFNSRSYLELMQWIAAKAAVTLAETGQITVVVQDNGSIHKSQIVGYLGRTRSNHVFPAALLLRDESLRLWRGEALRRRVASD